MQVQERPKALQAELALTLKVWENVTGSALGTILDQPLHTLRHIHTQLQTCVSPGSLPPPACPCRHVGFLVCQQQPHSPHLCPQMQPQPTAEPRPLSRCLSRWLQRLQEAQRKVSLEGAWGLGPLGTLSPSSP